MMGLVHYDIRLGGTNADAFHEFMKKCVRVQRIACLHPDLRVVFVMDSAAIHKTPAIRESVVGYGTVTNWRICRRICRRTVRF